MKIFSFVKKVFILGLTVLSSSITDALNCTSINNQECKVRPEIIDVSSNNPIFYPFSVKKVGVYCRCILVYIVLTIMLYCIVIVLTIISIVISTVYAIYFIYYNWFLIKNKDFFTKYNTHRETLIYWIQYINGVIKTNKY